jgi:hypothetical protein
VAEVIAMPLRSAVYLEIQVVAARYLNSLPLSILVDYDPWLADRPDLRWAYAMLVSNRSAGD